MSVLVLAYNCRMDRRNVAWQCYSEEDEKAAEDLEIHIFEYLRLKKPEYNMTSGAECEEVSEGEEAAELYHQVPWRPQKKRKWYQRR